MSAPPPRTTLELQAEESILAAIRAEREYQHGKWGQQDRTPDAYLMILGEELGEAFIAEPRYNSPPSHQTGQRLAAFLRKEYVIASEIRTHLVQIGHWCRVQMEAGALGPNGEAEASLPPETRHELIQCAAVLVAMIACGDRNGWWE